MPHINDLTINNIFEGNNGEKWIVSRGDNDKEEIMVILKKMKVEEKLVLEPEEDENIQN